MSLYVMHINFVRGQQSNCLKSLMDYLQWRKRKLQCSKERGWMLEAKANKCP